MTSDGAGGGSPPRALPRPPSHADGQAGRPERFHRPVPHFQRPQIVEMATLKRGRKGWYLAYTFPPAFRMFEMGFTFPLPAELNAAIEASSLKEGARLPVYVHQYIDASKEDAPKLRSDPGSADEE